MKQDVVRPWGTNKRLPVVEQVPLMLTNQHLLLVGQALIKTPMPVVAVQNKQFFDGKYKVMMFCNLDFRSFYLFNALFDG